MAKLVSSILMSLDGFASGPNGALNIFNVDQEFFDYSEELASRAGTALYGRGTYHIMEAYWPTAADKPDASAHDKSHAAWYKNVEKLVASTTLKTVGPGARIISSNLAEEINRLKLEEEKDIQIFGSPGLVNSLMQQGLIDEYWIFIAPVVIGEGIQLFKQIQHRVDLKLVAAKPLKSGFIAAHYQRVVQR